MKVSIDRVIEAASAIPRPFVRAPQFRSEGLSRLLGVEVILKVETVNPAGSVMGRAAEWWFTCHPDAHRVVAPSADDFGTAMGLAGAARGIEVEVFGPVDADRAKVEALRHFGTVVRLGERTVARRFSGRGNSSGGVPCSGTSPLVQWSRPSGSRKIKPYPWCGHHCRGSHAVCTYQLR